MTPAATLLHKLLEYIREQAKDIDPRGFRLSDSKKFLCRREALVGLPGVEFDLKVAGDHIWLRLQRLEANPPPSLPKPHKDLIRVSADPDGPKPSLEEAALLHRLSHAAEGQTPEERARAETLGREAAAKALDLYLTLWESWAEGERPRRTSIALYGELFALKHYLESEETAKPHELVWGIGVASWRIPYEGASMAFEYPLLTQTVEISMDESILALELRPRATNSHVELDAFIACQVTGAAD